MVTMSSIADSRMLLNIKAVWSRLSNRRVEKPEQWQNNTTIMMPNLLTRPASSSIVEINRYLKLIKSKGANETDIHERNEFLSRLSIHLDTLPKSNRSFRQALKKVLDDSSRNEWTFYLTVSREYLPFWINDIHAIAVLTKNNSFNLNISRSIPQLINIDRLRDQVLSTSFVLVEKWALNNYAESLRQNLEPKESITIKLIMAKMITFELRSIELPSINAYKMAVDLLIPSFESTKARNLFLEVSSDFFSYYDGHRQTEAW